MPTATFTSSVKRVLEAIAVIAADVLVAKTADPEHRVEPDGAGTLAHGREARLDE